MSLWDVIGVLVFVWLIGHAVRQFAVRGPRSRLSWGDWEPHGWLGTMSILCVGLIYCGGAVLFGAHQSFRWGGALALLGGLVLLAVIIGYVRRPAANPSVPEPSTSDATLPPFHRTLRGYDRHQVDQFFAGIWSKPSDQIEQARFVTRFHGYQVEEVDQALDGWLVRQRTG